MAKKRILQPGNPIHPGEMLVEEFLVPAGKTQTAFAREIGWTRARLNEFIKGKRGVTA
jgi:addiction module HigA family antidote